MKKLLFILLISVNFSNLKTMSRARRTVQIAARNLVRSSSYMLSSARLGSANKSNARTNSHSLRSYNSLTTMCQKEAYEYYGFKPETLISSEQLNQLFKNVAQLYHPDKNPFEKESQKEFIRAKDALNVIKEFQNVINKENKTTLKDEEIKKLEEEYFKRYQTWHKNLKYLTTLQEQELKQKKENKEADESFNKLIKEIEERIESYKITSNIEEEFKSYMIFLKDIQGQTHCYEKLKAFYRNDRVAFKKFVLRYQYLRDEILSLAFEENDQELIVIILKNRGFHNNAISLDLFNKINAPIIYKLLSHYGIRWVQVSSNLKTFLQQYVTSYELDPKCLEELINPKYSIFDNNSVWHCLAQSANINGEYLKSLKSKIDLCAKIALKDIVKKNKDLKTAKELAKENQKYFLVNIFDILEKHYDEIANSLNK